MMHLFSLIAIAAQLAPAPAEEPTDNAAEETAKSGMRRPVEIKHKSQAGQRVVEGLGAILAKELSPVNRKRLGSKVLSASRVSIVQGSFAGGGTRVVAINVNLRMSDTAVEQQYIGGIVTVDDSGNLVSVVVPPRMRPLAYGFEKLGDTDGDGSDDFVYSATGSEQTWRYRVTWKGTEPSTTELQN